jgi:hypothetical protein
LLLSAVSKPTQQDLRDPGQRRYGYLQLQGRWWNLRLLQSRRTKTLPVFRCQTRQRRSLRCGRGENNRDLIEEVFDNAKVDLPLAADNDVSRKGWVYLLDSFGRVVTSSKFHHHQGSLTPLLMVAGRHGNYMSDVWRWRKGVSSFAAHFSLLDPQRTRNTVITTTLHFSLFTIRCAFLRVARCPRSGVEGCPDTGDFSHQILLPY